MYEQDYIMRLIREMVRAILQILFHIELPSQVEELLSEEDSKADHESMQMLKDLYALVDAGKINEAENKLSDLTEAGTQGDLKLALLFYAYLNEKDADFLEANGYSREEVKDGVQRLVESFGLEGIVEAFL